MLSASPTDWVAGFQASRLTGREGQAYLIEGHPKGAALDTAIGFLQSLFCATRASDSPPCGSCAACGAIRKRCHPDVRWIEPEGASRQIPIDTVREQALAVIRKTSFQGGWKGLVFLQADRLTEQAANALLKALEEPPPRTLLLLVSDAADRIPRTVLSRCRRIRAPGGAPPMDPEDRHRVLERLSGLGAKASSLARIAAAAELADLLETRAAAIEAEANEELPGEDPDIRAARIRTRKKEVAADLLRLLELWQRDLLLYAVNAPDALLGLPECAEALRRQANGLRPADAIRRIEAVETARRRLDLNLGAESVFDGFFQFCSSQLS